MGFSSVAAGAAVALTVLGYGSMVRAEDIQHHVLSAQIGISKLPDDTPDSASADEKAYNRALASGRTFQFSFANFGEHWTQVGFDFSFSYFASGAKLGGVLEQQVRLYYPALGFVVRWPFESLRLEPIAHVRAGPMLYFDKVSLNGQEVLISSPQAGYDFGIDLNFMPFKYLGVGVSYNRYLASVKELYSNYGDHVDLEKPFGLNRNEYAVSLVFAFDMNFRAPSWGTTSYNP